MFKKSWVFFLFSAIIEIIFGNYAIAQLPPCGSPLFNNEGMPATHKGVTAFSNGTAQTTGESCGTQRGEWQCTEYVKRFYSQALSVDTSHWVGDAFEYFSTAEMKNLLAFSNHGLVPPAVDDILVFEGRENGHIAIITKVTGTSVEIIEQNWSLSGIGIAIMNLDSNGGIFRISRQGSHYTVLGWLRKPPTWIKLSPINQPSPRVMFAMAYDEARGQIVLFGGYDREKGLVDETWIWKDGNWSQWTKGAFTSNPPAMRGHSMAYDAIHKKIVLFGGNVLGNNTWLWDGNGWEQVPITSPWPNDRAYQAMAYDWSKGEIILHGGQAHASTGYNGWNDTWVWDGATWIERLPITSDVPNWRYLSAMSWDPITKKVIRFGGRSISCGSGCYDPITHNDTWLWDGTTWQQQFPTETPLPREGHAMAIDPASKLIMVLGGDVLTSTYPHIYEQQSDTWLWDGKSWSLAAPNNPALRTQARTFAIAPDLWNGQMILFTSPALGVSETWVWK